MERKLLGVIILGVGVYLLLRREGFFVSGSMARYTPGLKSSRGIVRTGLGYEIGFRPDWEDYIDQIAREEGVDPDLIRAIIEVESGGRVYARRLEKTGFYAIGLMQVTLPAARDVGYRGPEDGLFDPYTNIKYGTRYLRKMIDRFHGDLYKAIAAYNAGPSNVERGRYNKWYVAKVLAIYKRRKLGIT